MDITKKVRIKCRWCEGTGNGSSKGNRCWRCKGAGKIWVPKDWYYACLMDDEPGRISMIVAGPCTKEQAEAHLKIHYKDLWLNCEAIPQPVTHPYFK